RPTDTWDKLDPQGLELVTAFTARIVAAAAGAAAAPAYVRAQPAPAAEPPRGGYGPVFGVVPDFGESAEPGARISGVRPGSPAEKAGMRAGDIIVQFAGVSVKRLDDLTFALRGRRGGPGGGAAGGDRGGGGQKATSDGSGAGGAGLREREPFGHAPASSASTVSGRT